MFKNFIRQIKLRIKKLVRIYRFKRNRTYFKIIKVKLRLNRNNKWNYIYIWKYDKLIWINKLQSAYKGELFWYFNKYIRKFLLWNIKIIHRLYIYLHWGINMDNN
jgi:hypothetical protein